VPPPKSRKRGSGRQASLVRATIHAPRFKMVGPRGRKKRAFATTTKESAYERPHKQTELIRGALFAGLIRPTTASSFPAFGWKECFTEDFRFTSPYDDAIDQGRPTSSAVALSAKTGSSGSSLEKQIFVRGHEACVDLRRSFQRTTKKKKRFEKHRILPLRDGEGGFPGSLDVGFRPRANKGEGAFVERSNGPRI